MSTAFYDTIEVNISSESPDHDKFFTKIVLSLIKIRHFTVNNHLKLIKQKCK